MQMRHKWTLFVLVIAHVEVLGQVFHDLQHSHVESVVNVGLARSVKNVARFAAFFSRFLTFPERILIAEVAVEISWFNPVRPIAIWKIINFKLIKDHFFFKKKVSSFGSGIFGKLREKICLSIDHWTSQRADRLPVVAWTCKKKIKQEETQHHLIWQWSGIRQLLQQHGNSMAVMSRLTSLWLTASVKKKRSTSASNPLRYYTTGNRNCAHSSRPATLYNMACSLFTLPCNNNLSKWSPCSRIVLLCIGYDGKLW